MDKQRNQSHKSLFPAGVLLVGLIGLPVALVRELHSNLEPVHVMRAVFIVIYMAWVSLETRITMGSAREEASEVDRGTLQLYGSARVLTMLIAVFVPSMWHSIGPWTAAALLVFVAGIALRLFAIRTLGRFYSHQVRTLDEHAVVGSGPYRWIRHPSYTGMVLAHLGFILFFCSAASVLAFSLLLVPSIVLRIVVEEQALMSRVSGYADYARERKRLVPLLW